jgi:hypothetical protein
LPEPEIALAKAVFYLALLKRFLEPRGDLIMPDGNDQIERKERKYPRKSEAHRSRSVGFRRRLINIIRERNEKEKAVDTERKNVI